MTAAPDRDRLRGTRRSQLCPERFGQIITALLKGDPMKYAKFSNFLPVMILLVSGVVPAFANSGDLDYSFNNNGYVRFGFGGGDDAGQAAAMQPDGKIVVVASTRQASRMVISVVRYMPDGSFDPSFNSGGKVFLRLGNQNTLAGGVAIQPDGKIVIAGSTRPWGNRDFVVIRLNSDGSRDTGFGADGVSDTTDFTGGDDDARQVLLQADGKIVVLGGVQSYYPNGYRGHHFGVARYNTNGSIDLSFNGIGRVTTGEGYASSGALQTDGKIVAGGWCEEPNGAHFYCAVRFTAAGPVDASFNGTGKAVTDLQGAATGIAVQPDGKVVLVGSSLNGAGFAFARFHADGTPDNSFGTGGKVLANFSGNDDGSQARSLIVQPDGKIFASGYARPVGYSHESVAAMRLESDGSFDNSFDGDGKLVVSPSSGTDRGFGSLLAPDGKILIVGSGAPGDNDDLLVSRFDADGSSDPTFGAGGSVIVDLGDKTSRLKALALQPDGKMVLAGNLSQSGPRVARLNADGTFDTGLNGTGKVILSAWSDFNVTGVAVQPDGKILVAGIYGSTSMVGRLNADGTIDESFGVAGQMILKKTYVNALTLQPDGKILLGGKNAGAGGLLIIRLVATGRADNTFDRDGRVSAYVGNNGGEIKSIAVQPDGKIVGAGQANDGQVAFLLTRVNVNGSFDTTFGTDGFTLDHPTQWESYATSLALDADGKAVVAGYVQMTPIDVEFVVARYENNGAVDTSFNGTGANRTYLAPTDGRAMALAFRSDGKIVLGGNTGTDISTVRFHPNGVQDTAQWGNRGLARANIYGEDNGVAMAIDSLGRPIVAGTSEDLFCVTRFTSEFAPSTLVSVSGRVTTPYNLTGPATISMTDIYGVTRTQLTDMFGYYKFDDVQTGTVYDFEVSARGYYFTVRQVTVGGELTDNDFVPDGGVWSRETGRSGPAEVK